MVQELNARVLGILYRVENAERFSLVILYKLSRPHKIPKPICYVLHEKILTKAPRKKNMLMIKLYGYLYNKSGTNKWTCAPGSFH